MKRFLLPLMIGVLGCGNFARADDPATAAAVAAAAARVEAEEKFNSLKGRVEDIAEAVQARNRRVDEQMQQLARDLSDLRQQSNKPKPIYATPEDLKRLAEAIQEVDRKRVNDAERFSNELKEMLKKLLAVPPPPRPAPVVAPQPTPTPPPQAEPDKTKLETTEPPAGGKNEEGFEYTVRSGDNFVKISKAYAAKGLRVTVDQIQKANPGVKSERLIIGKKLWIPGTLPAGGGKE